MEKMARPEHPNPQMQRKNWMNLNGTWEFEFDFGDSGLDRKLYEQGKFSREIQVPFCPESSLSGIGYQDFMAAVWYRRTFCLTKEQLQGRVLLHFGAVDYECRAFVNGKEAGRHKGGYSSFQFDITDLVKEGENCLAVYARDDIKSGRQPVGKQSREFYSHGCDYTRTTGIWQTVWLEFVPKSYLRKMWFYPNIQEGTLTIKAQTAGEGELSAKALYEDQVCGCASAHTAGGNVHLMLKLSRLELWEPGKGRLYDLELDFGEDHVNSYFGMRSLALDGERFLINGRSVFQRLVLDQGFYPDGIYTAPEEEALIRDIELSRKAGFNGARLHQKIFEPRFLYHCDRMGYLVWGEQGNWGMDYSAPDSLKNFLPEWMEALERDFNHPSIVGWCPFNETWDYAGRRQDDDLLRIVYHMTKQYDTTRPCIDTSGLFHVITDIYDLHDYTQEPAEFAERYREFSEGGRLFDALSSRQTPVKGVPVFLSEYGGIGWNGDTQEDTEGNWGYGDMPRSEEEFIERYKGLTEALLDNPHMFGFCYTQLYDVEQEVNGLYTYQREPKFDMEIFREINSRKAAIEEQ